MAFLLVKLSAGYRLDVMDGTEKPLLTKVLE